MCPQHDARKEDEGRATKHNAQNSRQTHVQLRVVKYLRQACQKLPAMLSCYADKHLS